MDSDLNVFLMEANMSPNLSTGHFIQNQLLYEQVIFNILSVVGVASKLSSKFENDDEIEEMQVSDRDLFLSIPNCETNECLTCNKNNFEVC